MKTKVKASHVIAFQDGRHVHLQDGEVVFADGVIEYVGHCYEDSCTDAVDRTIDGRDHLVVPGLISTHGHVTDAPFNKSYLDDEASRNFFQSNLYEQLMVIWPTPEEALIGARAAMAEMLRNGCTTFLDMTPDYPAYGVSGDASIPELVAESAAAIGARACIVPSYRSGVWSTTDGRTVSYQWLPDHGFSGFEANLRFLDKYHGRSGGRITSMLGPAQVDTCTEELLQETARTARALDVGITIHAAQSIPEFHTIIERHGVTPIRFLHDLGILGEKTIVAHCIFVSGHSQLSYPGDDDLTLLAATQTSVAHSPRGFANTGTILESLKKYQARGINVSMATDTVPLNILEEMRLAGACCRIAERDAQSCTALDLFNAATLGGAKALGRSDLGRLAPGAKADMLLVDLKTPRMAPVRDLLKNFVYHATAQDIAMVIVDGDVVVDGGVVKHMDQDRLAREVQTASEKVWQRMADLDWAGRDIDAIAPPQLGRGWVETGRGQR